MPLFLILTGHRGTKDSLMVNDKQRKKALA